MDNTLEQILRNGTTLTRYYYLKDHLGSIKMMVDASGNVQSYNDYYPYGMTMPGRSGTMGADTRFRFTGKERDVESGFDYFGARYYDSRIARWMSVDPLAGKYPEIAPYVYTHNNPINRFDPDGKGDQTSERKKEEAAQDIGKGANAIAEGTKKAASAVRVILTVGTETPEAKVEKGSTKVELKAGATATMTVDFTGKGDVTSKVEGAAVVKVNGNTIADMKGGISRSVGNLKKESAEDSKGIVSGAVTGSY